MARLTLALIVGALAGVQVSHGAKTGERAVATAAAAASAAATSAAGVAASGTSGIGTSSFSDTSTYPTGTLLATGTMTPSSAPAIPSTTPIPSNYPALDRPPPTDNDQVRQWVSQIDLTKVPNIAVNQVGGCTNASNAQALQNAAANGWWTCGGYVRTTDITTCPTKDTWGLSYDDGPSPSTPRLLDYLSANSLKTTFFVVGSRVISYPNILIDEYSNGHQIAVHTWSHFPLTTLTNEQIVAELGWSKKVIQETIGVTPVYMRPPYGDIDDRVRAISVQMGLTPIIWTAAFDTFDWHVPSGLVNQSTVVSQFENILQSAATNLSAGFIVLEHDLWPQTVNLAVTELLPYALNMTKNGNLTIQPIVQCEGGSLAQAYVETGGSTTNPPGLGGKQIAGTGQVEAQQEAGQVSGIPILSGYTTATGSAAAATNNMAQSTGGSSSAANGNSGTTSSASSQSTSTSSSSKSGAQANRPSSASSSVMLALVACIFGAYLAL